MKLTRDLKEFFELLASHEVRYLVVGGGAVNAHGYVRMTEDFDFWIATDPGNAERVARLIESFGFGELALSAQDFMVPGQIIMLGRPPNRIDLLTSITGVDFEDAYARRSEGVMDGVRMPLISVEDLLINKRATGRLKDMADVEEFERSEKYSHLRHAPADHKKWGDKDA